MPPLPQRSDHRNPAASWECVDTRAKAGKRCDRGNPINKPTQRTKRGKNPQRPPPKSHICVIVQPNSSGNMVVWSSPELHPPQFAIDCCVCIHHQHRLLEFRWNVAEAWKSREPTISEVPQNSRDVGRNGE